MNKREIDPRVLRSSRYMPIGAAPVGTAISGCASLFSDSWIPLILFLVPWTVWAGIHYVNRDQFLHRASWNLKMNVFGLSLAFIYPSALNTITAAFDFYGPMIGSALTVGLSISFFLYSRYYYKQHVQAWNKKRRVNFRFALCPEDNTYRVREGFNYGSMESLGWDDQVFGLFLSISTTGAAFLGGLFYEDTLKTPLAVMAVLGAILCLIFLRTIVSKELVAIAKIQEYEREYNVQIRPR